MITPKKWQKLRQWMEQLEIQESDLKEIFIIGSGHGGQNLHKTSSCVNIMHFPSGISIKCQQSRSRESNRYYARKRLCEKIETITLLENSQKRQEIEKIRRQKRKRSKRAKLKIRKTKTYRSDLKNKRKSPMKTET